MRHIESHLQQVCVKWARLQFPVCRELMFSVPNAAKLKVSTAMFLRGEGRTPGVADVLFLHPSADRKYFGLAIEFKIGYNKQSERQKAWQKALESLGCYLYAVVYSFDEFKELINNYL